MTPILLWMNDHPWTFAAVAVAGSALMLWLAVYWPLGHADDRPAATGPPSHVRLLGPYARPFDWSTDAPEMRADPEPIP